MARDERRPVGWLQVVPRGGPLPLGVGGRVAVADLPPAARSVGRDHRFPVSFLAGGIAVQRSVVAIGIGAVDGGPGLAVGVLVAPGLLLTTHESLPDAHTAMRSLVRLDAGGRAAPDGIEVALDPWRLFHTSPAVGYTIVAICTGVRHGPPRPSSQPLSRWRDEFAVGQLLNVVDHDGTGACDLALQDDTVTAVLARSIRSTSDTGRHTPGAPLYSTGWGLVALHRRSGTEVDGVVVDNEAVRVDAIVEDLRAELRSTDLVALSL